MKSDIKTRILGHKGWIVVDTADLTQDEDFIPAGGSRIGCVLANTKERLGISDEALELLKKIPKSHDDIGDVDCFKSGDKWIFGWLGPARRLISTVGTSGSSSYDINALEFKRIPNDVPVEAKNAVEYQLVEE
jgi:hypothetical protein